MKKADSPVPLIRKQILAGKKRGTKRHLELLTSAANNGDADAIYVLANWQWHGVGMRKNATQAASHFLKAAKLGQSHAIYHLALCYERGRGVAKDEHQAFLWYRRGAKLRDVPCISELARCYYYGIGCKRQLKRAFDCNLIAAKKGVHEAQYNVAFALQFGDGVQPSRKRAMHWYSKVAASKSALTRKALHALAQLR